jgi:hypothetical protein
MKDDIRATVQSASEDPGILVALFLWGVLDAAQKCGLPSDQSEGTHNRIVGYVRSLETGRRIELCLTAVAGLVNIYSEICYEHAGFYLTRTHDPQGRTAKNVRRNGENSKPLIPDDILGMSLYRLLQPAISGGMPEVEAKTILEQITSYFTTADSNTLAPAVLKMMSNLMTGFVDACGDSLGVKLVAREKPKPWWKVW